MGLGEAIPPKSQLASALDGGFVHHSIVITADATARFKVQLLNEVNDQWKMPHSKNQ